MMKKLIISAILALFATYANAQDSVKTIDGNKFYKYGATWYEYSQKYDDTFRVNSKIITVKFKNNVTTVQINSFLSTYGLTMEGKPILGWYNLNIGSAYIFNKFNQIKNNSIINKSFIPTYGRFFAIPSDPLYADQWYLHRIKADSAWDITTGDTSIIVAVMDGGFAYKGHMDLNKHNGNYSYSFFGNEYDNVFKNYNEQDWTSYNHYTTGNGIDNDDWDGNPSTYIDDWKGWCFWTGITDEYPSNNPFPSIFTPIGADTSYVLEHGTAVAGIIGAKTNNSFYGTPIGIAGIAGGWNSNGCKILNLKVGDGGPSGINMTIVPEAILYACQLNANIINMSFGGLDNPAVAEAIAYALGQGVTIVIASGNYGLEGVSFPANIEGVVAVGATGTDDNRANFSGLCNPLPFEGGSSYGSELCVSAPGTCILTTTLDPVSPRYRKTSGTSFSAPQVSGVAALILSVNPCLGNKQVADVLKYTADKTGGYNYNWNPIYQPGHSKELGWGRLNAYAAVKTAQAMRKETLDLYMRDRYYDFGIEPNADTGPIWISTDIWIRNSIDAETIHENPVYHPTNPVYVYVRITNKSCVNYTSGATLKVYWAKASTGVGWPNPWNDTGGSPQQGGVIGTITIPAISSGKDTILRLTWSSMPNPADYPLGGFTEGGLDGGGFTITPSGDNHHFCLLARIDATSDPMYATETSIVNDNVRKNNNIIQKNISIMDGSSFSGRPKIIGIGNFTNATATNFNLSLIADEIKNGNKLPTDAQVILKLDSTTWQKWVTGGMIMGSINPTTGAFTQNAGISIKDQAKYELLITNPYVCLKNLNYTYLQNSRVAVNVYFPSSATPNKYYTYDLVQTQTNNNKIIGGVRLEVKSPQSNQQRPLLSLDNEKELVIYPNPTSSILSYKINNDTYVYSINVIDINGRSIPFINLGNSIDVSKLASGTYILSLNTNKGILTDKFVKQ